MATHKVVKHDEWLRARKKHLAKEKEFTRMRDQLRLSLDLPVAAPGGNTKGLLSSRRWARRRAGARGLMTRWTVARHQGNLVRLAHLP